MAGDEAVLRVMLEGSGGASPESPAGSRPDRPAREERRPQARPEPAGRPAFRPESPFNQLIAVLSKFRGTIGGILGPLAGVALDVAKSFRDAEEAAHAAADGMRSLERAEKGRAERIADRFLPSPPSEPLQTAIPAARQPVPSLARSALPSEPSAPLPLTPPRSPYAPTEPAPPRRSATGQRLDQPPRQPLHTTAVPAQPLFPEPPVLRSSTGQRLSQPPRRISPQRPQVGRYGPSDPDYPYRLETGGFFNPTHQTPAAGAALPVEHALPMAQAVPKSQIPTSMKIGVGQQAIAGVGQTAAGSLAEGLAGAAGPVAAAFAVVEATKALKAGMQQATSAAGDFAKGMTSPEVSAASFAEGIGAAGKKASDALVYIEPASAVVVGVLGQLADSFGGLMKNMDAMAARFTGFGPGVAQAQAMATVQHIAGEFRRGREVGDSLSRYVIARTELQEKWEDVKAKFLVQITPAVVSGIKMLERLLPLAETAGDEVSGLAKLLLLILAPVDGLAKFFIHQNLKQPVKITDLSKRFLDEIAGAKFAKGQGG